jgi:beta-glucanase (GH16 family)
VLTADEDVTPGAQCGPIACRYASARLTMLDWEDNEGLSSWSQAGGHLEARMRAPLGKGLWPVFWTVGANNSVVARTLTAAQAGSAWAQSFRNTHAMILNLAVGGDEWVGEPDADTVFPAQLKVDWVRVYQNPMA